MASTDLVKPSIRSALPPGGIRGNAYLLIALLSLPLLALPSRGMYLWTDVDEIHDLGFIRTTWADLLFSITHGIDGEYYRPTILLLHSLDFALFGDSPLAFRLTNLLIHVASVFLIYSLATRVLRDRELALPTAVLFGVHPLIATPIGWISDRTDLVALLTSLGFFHLVRRYVIHRRAIYLIGAGLLLAIGLGAKETVAATLLITIALVLTTAPPIRLALARVIGAQLILIGFWFLWRNHVSTSHVERLSTRDLSAIVALTSYIHLQYVRQLIAPWTLAVCDGTEVPRLLVVWIAAGLMLSATLALAIVSAFRRKDKAMLIALAWTLAFLLPTSGLVALKHVRADRYLYCSLPGMSLGGVLIARSVTKKLTDRRRGIRIAAFLVCYAYFASLLLFRARRFADDVTLWTFETARNGLCLEGFGNLARANLVQGRLDTALLYSNRALKPLSPGDVAFVDADGCLQNRALILLELGQIGQAKALFRYVMDTARSGAVRGESAYELGLIATGGSDFRMALQYFNAALDLGLRPRSQPDLFLLRSYANLRFGNVFRARQDYEIYMTTGKRDDSPQRQRLAAQMRSELATK